MQDFDPGDIEEILDRLHATYPCVMDVDVTGCRSDVLLRAPSVRKTSMFGGSPLDVRAQLMGLGMMMSFICSCRNKN